MEIAGGSLRLGGGAKDSPVVVGQDLQPRLDVAGMIGARFQCQTKVSAEEGAAEFGDKFLCGVSGVAPPSAPKIAVQPFLVTGPMGAFMCESCIERYRVTKILE
jgi:hypothetical protein